MWDRRRFIAVLATATATIAIALTIALTTVAMSVQETVAKAPEGPATSAASAVSSSTTTAETPYNSGPRPAPTTTLTIPPYSSGPGAAARNFAEHWLQGAHIKDFTDDRRRWVDELVTLGDNSLSRQLDMTRQDSMPMATIVNTKVTEYLPGAPGATTLATFDLSDATILAVEVQRAPGGQAPWKVTSYRYNK